MGEECAFKVELVLLVATSANFGGAMSELLRSQLSYGLRLHLEMTMTM